MVVVVGCCCCCWFLLLLLCFVVVVVVYDRQQGVKDRSHLAVEEVVDLVLGDSDEEMDTGQDEKEAPSQSQGVLSEVINRSIMVLSDPMMSSMSRPSSVNAPSSIPHGEQLTPIAYTLGHMASPIRQPSSGKRVSVLGDLPPNREDDNNKEKKKRLQGPPTASFQGSGPLPLSLTSGPKYQGKKGVIRGEE